MRKIIILAFGFILFSACTDGTLSLDENQPKVREDVTFKPFPEKPIDTVDSEKEKREKEREKNKGTKEGENGKETNEGKPSNP
ncbi:hypothetical protein MT996_09405 [Ornithobacterium rhinotracheale]|uniref:hypothetical protein n=1 Tax=Ornithobacterium rhinotracheale TaxID=28251 RepID=UPI00129CA241|nr:hypothetical protein [Ornithobacterium rhinotracheale]UOH77422.1 hypothetical protein MT996_09405 [Ornithobacterium rhinotracheale]